MSIDETYRAGRDEMMNKPWHAAIWGGVLIFLFVLLAGCTDSGNDITPASAAAGAGAGGAARKIVVFDETVVNEAAQDQIVNRTGSVKVKSLPNANAVVVLANQANENALKETAGVLRVDDDVIVHASPKPPGTPGGSAGGETAPAEALPWGVNRIDADLVWDINVGAGVKVAVVDTGIDLDHPDLAANIFRSYNAINTSKSADDDNGHGTHVAGTIAAVDNTIGVIGVAPQASLLAVKVLDRRGSGYLSDIIEGIDWSIANGAQVINMSLGTSSNIQSFHDAVKRAYNAGVVVVAAAGNSGPGDDTVNYPAKYTEVIAVSATDSSDGIASFSSRGSEVELAAPGVNIPSTYKGGGYKTISGTSMASPHVAGVAALVIASGTSGVENVRTVLKNTADNLGSAGKDDLYGYGLVDAEQAATGTQTNP
jgi:subtilisin family serine protease